MLGIVAIIVLIARYRRRGHGWFAAILKGFCTYLLGLIAIYGIVFLLIATGFVASVMNPAANAVLGIFVPAQPSSSQLPRSVAPLPTRKPVATSTPINRSVAPDIEARVTAVTLPTSPPNDPDLLPGPLITPTAGTIILSPGRTPTPSPARGDLRAGCDPAYPEARTCIPPGPPWGQGCGITSERIFTVLPPDPQRLDADGDGIGCEPMT